jgi:hypothetical protein
MSYGQANRRVVPLAGLRSPLFNYLILRHYLQISIPLFTTFVTRPHVLRYCELPLTVDSLQRQAVT